jgi:hypothetical protein
MPRDPNGTPDKPPSSAPEMFSPENPPAREQDRKWLPWVVAAAIVVLGLAVLAVLGGRHPASNTPDATLQPNPYAANLELTDLHLSQATNFAGGQVTYVDGNLTNHGKLTVSGVTVAVTFANAAGEQPQVETVPLLLIRAHQPYVDTEPVSAAPLAPGSTHEFRLIFDDVSPLWDQQTPQVRVLGVRTSNP